MKSWRHVGAMAAAALAAGCGADPDKGYGPVSGNGNGNGNSNPPITELGQSLAALTAVEGCDEVLELLKQQAIESTKAEVEQSREMMLQMLDDEYGCMMAAEGDFGAGGGVATGAPAPGGAVNDGGGAKEYSTTNNQVSGVDEADFLKNDGEHVYVLADGKLQIVDVWPPEQAHVVSLTDIEGTPKKLFVHKDRALVYSSLQSLSQGSSYPGDYYGDWEPKECTYGYDCDFTGDGKALKMTLLDISDRANPTLLREIELTGSYLNSRRIGDFAFTVVTFPELSVPGVKTMPDELGNYWDWCWDQTNKPTAAQVNAAFDALNTANEAIIAESDVTDYLPSVVDTRHAPGQEPLVESGLLSECKGFYKSESKDGASLLSVLTLEVDDLGAIGATTVVGRPGAVYASADALYIGQRHYAHEMGGAWFWEGNQESDEATTVHKFAIDAATGAAAYAGSGVVKGRVLNQFAMDEWNGNLRIATTTGHLPDPETHSTLSVLGQGEGELTIIGQIDGIAKTEDIRSVRFDGDRGFVVTFKKTDPLFVFDLSDPTAPAIRGELKIPGFSTYMHMMDDDHILSIGYDADDQGDFAWFQGIQLQIMDVADPQSPKLDHKEVIGSRGTASDAATNHLAFNYFAPKGLLAIPMTVCEGGSGGSYGDLMTFNGLLVYEVSATGGFTKVGGISHVAPESQENAWGACSSWWTDGSSVVQRSIFMNDYVLSIAVDQIKIAKLTDLAHPVASVQIAEPTWPNEPGW